MNSEEEILRVFLGIELDERVRETVTLLQSELGGMVEGVRWVRPENLHITLKFLGDCDRQKVDEVITAVEPLGEYLPCSVNVGGLGGFPSPTSARIVWVGAENVDGRLDNIWKNCERACRRLGFEKERREYHPHITIGRSRKKPLRLPWTGFRTEEKSLPMEVEGITIFRSVLKRTGAEYSVIHRVGVPRISGKTPSMDEGKGENLG